MAKLPPEYRHEPRLALAAGDDGLDLVRRILAEAPRHLRKDGALLCEIGRGRKPLERAYPTAAFRLARHRAERGRGVLARARDLTG